MFISRVVIENYRALEKIEVPFNRFSVIIGENDVGKTSLLHALNAFFENKKIDREETFFKKETDRIIKVTLTFGSIPDEPELKKLQWVDGTLTIQKVFKYCEAPVSSAIQENGSEKEIKAAIVKTWFCSDNFHFIPVRRDLSVQFSMAKTALLGKTLRAKMRKEFDGGAAAESIKDIQGVISKSIDGDRKELETFLREQMHNDQIDLGFNEVLIDPVEGVSFEVHLSDDRIKNVLIENRGAGTQNNLIIALFRLVAKMNFSNYIVFAMEEPENSLHPKAQRQLLSVLQEVGEKAQVVVTTHSPVFIERTKFESNILINRTQSGSSVAKTFNVSMLKELRADLGIRASDTLLKGGGNCALIVEGNTEEDGFPIFMEMMGLSEFRLGIAIINAGGSDATKLKNICKLLMSYDIPCVVVLDKDAKESADDLRRCKSNGEIKNIEDVFVLKKGTIEDYYPISIITEVINENLSPSTPVTTSEIDASLSGQAKLAKLKKVMFEHECGSSIEYLKKLIGSFGTKKFKEQGLPLDGELKTIFTRVEEVATR
jgi:putative ATP-dependent endonuclease of the OLD family